MTNISLLKNKTMCRVFPGYTEEVLFSIIKARAIECRAMAWMGVGDFEKEADMLEKMAESVKKAARMIAEHGASANEKARSITGPSCCCAAQTRMDMLRRGSHCTKEGGDIKREIMNTLSFLDGDPEVAGVVEAHEVVEYAGNLVDILLSPDASLVVKHIACPFGFCKFELWVKEKDDAKGPDTRKRKTH